MFQDFEDRSERDAAPARVAALRDLMREAEIDWLVVPHADEYQSEYLPANAERLAWLTGFTGSAGAAIVGRERAVVFADGRYTLQVRAQTDADTFDHASLVDEPPARWLETNMGAGETVAVDPMVHTRDGLKKLREAAARAGGRLVTLDESLLDRAWEAEGTRPPEPCGAVTIHHERLAGRLAKEKLHELREAVAKAGADMAVLTETAGLAWAFNIRGADVAHKPLVLTRAIVHAEGYPDLFIDDAKLDIEAKAYLTQLANLRVPATFLDRLREAASDRRVLLDPAQAPAALFDLVEAAGGTVVEAREPTVLPKAIKTDTELDGTRAAHMRDGAAVSTFLAWLDREAPGDLTEIDAARELEATRARMAGNDTPLRDISFDTISGSGPNGAIVHYRVTEASNRRLGAGELYLSDSGAQYEDGTTDITRTVLLGDTEPGDDERRAFTLVLKGHIAIATARFPEGTRGQDLDPLARNALWKAGMDYAHGTGHGVGSYLGVHEGPQNLSKRGTEPLVPGMIVSNEPGYYREGAFGIRIENLVIVHEPREIEGGDTPMLGFETITLAPIDRRLIDMNLLNDDEREWLDAYHARVFETLRDRVNEPTRTWLEAVTAPLDDVEMKDESVRNTMRNPWTRRA